MPTIINIQDPFERTSMVREESTNTGAFGYGNDFYAREFWRFVVVQQLVAKAAQSAIEYPPMQAPASFKATIKSREGQ
jgi:arylsulfatase